jgi:hypothetical protein
VQRAPGFPCALCSRRGATIAQSSGMSCRENADAHSILEMNGRYFHVIASAAKQSMAQRADRWIASLRSQ